MRASYFAILVRSLRRRVSNGESLETILASMKNLTDEDKDNIRKALMS